MDREAANRDAQEAVDVVSQWSRTWKLNLNATKSEGSFFSNCGSPSGNRRTGVGVTLDRQLTFGTHVGNVTKAAISSNRMLSALLHSSYGWRKQSLTSVYHAIRRNPTASRRRRHTG